MLHDKYTSPATAWGPISSWMSPAESFGTFVILRNKPHLLECGFYGHELEVIRSKAFQPLPKSCYT